MKFISGRDWARAWGDMCLKLKLEAKKPTPPSKLQLINQVQLEHKLVGKRRAQPVLNVYTHLPRGKVYDRKGKR